MSKTNDVLLTHGQAVELLEVFDLAHKTQRCPMPRLNNKGETSWKRMLRKSKREVEIPYGEHGKAFLVVNARTGEVFCGACAGTVDATVRTDDDGRPL